jgi:hypothetical protein
MALAPGGKEQLSHYVAEIEKAPNLAGSCPEVWRPSDCYPAMAIPRPNGTPEFPAWHDTIRGRKDRRQAVEGLGPLYASGLSLSAEGSAITRKTTACRSTGKAIFLR